MSSSMFPWVRSAWAKLDDDAKAEFKHRARLIRKFIKSETASSAGIGVLKELMDKYDWVYVDCRGPYYSIMNPVDDMVPQSALDQVHAYFSQFLNEAAE